MGHDFAGYFPGTATEETAGDTMGEIEVLYLGLVTTQTSTLTSKKTSRFNLKEANCGDF